MAITIDPPNPVAGDEVTLAITGATGSTDATRFELTSVPNLSALEIGELVDAAGEPKQNFIADAAGAYGISAYDYRRFSGVGGSSPGDPVGEARDELVAVQTWTIYVGDVLFLRIAGSGHSIAMRWVTLGTTVAEASLVLPTTERARQCALDSGVLAAVAALEGESVTTVGENLVTDVAALLADYSGHIEDLKYHYVSDDVNTVSSGSITTQAGAIAKLNEMIAKFLVHASNGGGNWHTTADLSNLCTVSLGADVATATVALVEFRRIFGGHIATTTGSMHKLADDGDYTPSADALLTVAVKAILTFFAAESPSTPTGESAASVAAAARYGFAPAS